MKNTKILKSFIATVLFAVTFILVAGLDKEKAYAMSPGYSFDLPIMLEEGRENSSIIFGKDDEKLYPVYYGIELSEQGLVTLKVAKKPASDTLIERYDIKIYSVSFATGAPTQGEMVWRVCPADYAEKNNVDYEYVIGLKAGSYCIEMTPIVGHTGLDVLNAVWYNFQPDPYCEVEPNYTYSIANKLELGKMYKGYCGEETSVDTKNRYKDVFYFQTEPGAWYHIKFAKNPYDIFTDTGFKILIGEKIMQYGSETLSLWEPGAGTIHYYTPEFDHYIFVADKHNTGKGYIYFSGIHDGEQKEYSVGVSKFDGWHYDNGVNYYYVDGKLCTNKWVQNSGKWYYFDANGAMQTGWVKVSGKWYYLNASGAMQTGWVKVSGKWYYLNASGAMQTGWVKVSGKWYYLNASGAMQTGWLKDGGKWYYLNASGAMQTGWVQVNGKWYYLTSSGAMAANTWIGNYYVDGNGVWTKTR